MEVAWLGRGGVPTFYSRAGGWEARDGGRARGGRGHEEERGGCCGPLDQIQWPTISSSSHVHGLIN